MTFDSFTPVTFNSFIPVTFDSYKPPIRRWVGSDVGMSSWN